MIRNYVSAFHSTKLYYKVKKLTSTCLTAQDIVLPHKMFLSSGNGLQMPAVGLGTSGVPKESILENAIDIALEAGYRHIDTAYVYNNEKAIGRILQKWLKSGKLKREDIFITTKLPVTGMCGNKVNHFLQLSLANLQLDYVDLYLIHFPAGCVYENDNNFPSRNKNGEVTIDPKSSYLNVWKEMEKQVDAGLAKAIGLSNFNISQINDILNMARIKPSCLQVELNVFFQQPKIVEFCRQKEICLTGFSPLGASNYNIKMKNAFKDYKERNLPDMLGDSTIKKIAEKHSKSPAQVVIRFLIQNGIAAIPKSHTPHRIIENLDVFNFSLDKDDLNDLRKLDKGEDAQITTFDFFPGIDKHPDYPWPQLKS